MTPKASRTVADVDLEATMRASEERYRAFVDHSTEGIWRLEFDPPIDTRLPVQTQLDLAYRHGRLAECNRAMARMYGLSEADELIGKSLDFMLPLDDPRARAYVASIIESGYRVTDVESTERDALGQTRYFRNSMSGVVEDGWLLRMWGTQRDISDRKLAERARAYLAAIVESSDDAIISKNLDGIIQSCNASAERLFGHKASELIGRPVRILIPPERQTEEDEILARIRLGQRIEHFETVRLTKDGQRIDVSLTVSPVIDDSGAIVGVSKVARDITERRRGEADRQAAAAERERLLEAERAARSEAERANLLKDELVAMVSHELRTPLNAILGWTELMTTHRRDASVLDRGLEVVARNTRIQAQLISDLLDVSRIATGNLRLEMRALDLLSVVNDSIETVQAEADLKGIEIVRTIDGVEHPVAGDAMRLQQVFWNLLSNAVKFTPRGGRICIAVDRHGEDARVVVSDSGAGIRSEFLPYVFDRFHQADRSITRRFGGLGLGLSIVKHLVELHGGVVEADSAGEGHGATFTILLPRHAGPPQAAGSSGASAVDGAPADPTLLAGLRVLVVEDEPDTLEFVRRLLESHGAVVSTAMSAPDALARFATISPDMLISDIGLPGVDGYDLVQQIRQQQGSAGGNIPAIALTAYARSEDRTRALRAGFQAHVAKPVEPEELVATAASFAAIIASQRRR